MVVRTRARQTRRRTLTSGVNPMQPAQKSETAKRTSRTARPTRTRTHRRTERRSWHRSHDRQPLAGSDTAKKAARLSGRGGGTLARSCWATTGRGSGGAPTAPPNAAARSRANSRTSDFCGAKRSKITTSGGENAKVQHEAGFAGRRSVFLMLG